MASYIRFSFFSFSVSLSLGLSLPLCCPLSVSLLISPLNSCSLKFREPGSPDEPDGVGVEHVAFDEDVSVLVQVFDAVVVRHHVRLQNLVLLQEILGVAEGDGTRKRVGGSEGSAEKDF